MEERGRQTDMPRASLPRDHRRAESVIWGLAIALAIVFALGQVLTVLAAAPAVVAFHAEAGDTPAFVSWAARIGPVGLGAVLGIIDAVVLAGCLWLARRYWIGIAFLPPVLYLGIGSVVLWLLVSGVLGAAAS